MKRIILITLISIMLLSSCAVISNEGNAGIDSPTTTSPGTTSPETTSPGTKAPETKAPETTASITKTPETTEAETKALETTSSVTTSPETAAPDPIVELHKTDVVIITNGLPRTDEGIEHLGAPTNAGLDYLFEYRISSVNAVSIEDAFSFTVKPNLSNNTVRKVGIIDEKDKFVPIIEAVTGKKFSELYADDFFEKNFIVYVHINGGGASPLRGFEYGYDTSTKLLKITYKKFTLDGIKDCPCEMLHDDGYFITIPKEAITVDGKMIPYEELNFRLTGYIEK